MCAVQVIAVSQDPLGLAGTRVAGSALSGSSTPTNVWARFVPSLHSQSTASRGIDLMLCLYVRKLSDGSIAMMFLNAGDQQDTVVCDTGCWNALGIKGSDFPLSAYDLWQHKALPDLTELSVSAPCDAEGGFRMIKVKSKRLAGTAGTGIQVLA